jgi:hypothetical protein
VSVVVAATTFSPRAAAVAEEETMATSATSGPRRSVAAILLAVLALGPSVAVAQIAAQPVPMTETYPVRRDRPAGLPEDDLVRSPDVAPPPRPETFPRLKEALSKMPPFFRDTDLRLRLRTFYFNRQNDDDTASEALATGGWIQYGSGWLFDIFAMGATYYGSFPLYAPDDRAGSLLLTPGQGEISVFGEAWARSGTRSTRF